MKLKAFVLALALGLSSTAFAQANNETPAPEAPKAKVTKAERVAARKARRAAAKEQTKADMKNPTNNETGKPAK